jgi:hypothetical protein
VFIPSGETLCYAMSYTDECKRKERMGTIWLKAGIRRGLGGGGCSAHAAKMH